jgi:hypothetical protein
MLQLRDLRIELLRGAAELHPAQPRNLELELLDVSAPVQLFLAAQFLALDDQLLQRSNVIRQLIDVQ